MTLGALFLTSVAVGFSGAVTPGPLLVASIARSARDGFRGGFWVTVGHAVLELLACAFLLLGLGSALVRPAVAPTIRVLGGLMLVYMGYGMARGASRGDMRFLLAEHTGSERAGPGPARPEVLRGQGHFSRRSGKGGPLGATLTGMAATVSGPYWIVWWATVGLGYLSLARPLGVLGVGAFYLGHISADFVWYSALSAAVAGGRRFLSDKAYRYLLLICGLVLLAIGGFFAWMGTASLTRIL